MARPQLFLKYPFPPHELFTIECERPVRLLPADCLVGLCKLCTPISAEVASFFFLPSNLHGPDVQLACQQLNRTTGAVRLLILDRYFLSSGTDN